MKNVKAARALARKFREYVKQDIGYDNFRATSNFGDDKKCALCISAAKLSSVGDIDNKADTYRDQIEICDHCVLSNGGETIPCTDYDLYQKIAHPTDKPSFHKSLGDAASLLTKRAREAQKEIGNV
jgi:hypothetical protein